MDFKCENWFNSDIPVVFELPEPAWLPERAAEIRWQWLVWMENMLSQISLGDPPRGPEEKLVALGFFNIPEIDELYKSRGKDPDFARSEIRRVFTRILLEEDPSFWLDNKDRGFIGPIREKMKELKSKGEAARPKRPEILKKFHRKGRWNEKVYGGSRYGYKIYINNTEIPVSDKDAEEINGYLQALEAWRERNGS